jgi:hypothetical protein
MLKSGVILSLCIIGMGILCISSSEAGVIPSWLKAKNKDSPKSGKELMCECPSSFEPLCGTDRVTYHNSCKFKCAMAKNKGTTTYKHAVE